MKVVRVRLRCRALSPSGRTNATSVVNRSRGHDSIAGRGGPGRMCAAQWHLSRMAAVRALAIAVKTQTGSAVAHPFLQLARSCLSFSPIDLSGTILAKPLPSMRMPPGP